MNHHLNCLFFNTRYNLHSVTSNAVAKLNSINLPQDYSAQVRNVLSIIDNAIVNRVTNLQIGGENISNAPDGTSANDFSYTIYKTNVNWIRVIAFDVRTNKIYVNVKRDGTWGTWEEILNTEIITGNATLNSDYVEFGAIIFTKVGNICQVGFNNVMLKNISGGYEDKIFASGLPKPIMGYNEFPVLQYDNDRGWVQLQYSGNEGNLRPSGYLNAGVYTWGSFNYICE